MAEDTFVGNDASKRRLLVIVGSPREGRCARLADGLARGARESGLLVDIFKLSSHEISGCINCESCAENGVCVIDDDMHELDGLIDGASALAIVTPVYFAGPPSQLKAVLDRLQPRWARRYLLSGAMPEKRPGLLVVSGTGGDPFGYGPLRTICRSACNLADFAMTDVVEFLAPDNSEWNPRWDERVREAGRILAHETLDPDASSAPGGASLVTPGTGAFSAVFSDAVGE